MPLMSVLLFNNEPEKLWPALNVRRVDFSRPDHLFFAQKEKLCKRIEYRPPCMIRVVKNRLVNTIRAFIKKALQDFTIV